jgi:hypothetical protein
MIRLVFMICLMLCAWTNAQSQTVFELLSEQKVEADRFVVDELGNLYLMSPTNVERRNAVGGGVFRTSELQWGNFHDIDVTDPLRPFIHFPSTGKVVFFDNTLSMQGSAIDLFEFSFDNIEQMCGSRGDGFWLWDARNSEIIRVDRNFNRLQSSGNLSILLKSEIEPQLMIEHGSFLYLLNRDNTLHVFDMFGSWKKRMEVGELSDFEADSDRVFLFGSDGKLSIVDTLLWQKQTMDLPLVGGRFSYHSSLLYSLQNGVLRVFKRVENTRN